MPGGWVYMVANRYRGTIYTGVTTNVAARAYQHHIEKGSRFAAKHHATRLVYVEEYPTIVEAITREKRVKKWLREWKIDLIEQANPDWIDLFETINN